MSHRSEAQQALGRMLVGIVVLSLTWMLPLHAQQTGRVSGRAVAAETGGALAGARVSVEGTSLSTTTDEAGRYVLLRVPAGSQTLRLSYIGRTPQTLSVAVAAGEVEEADFAVPVAAFRLEDITVLGSRAMVQAEALNRQKHAPNIQNIVASDQIGRFPDASAPEAVQRLPGIAVERDQGEGRYIQIRGGAAANTQVTFNGVQVPSPEGEERQIALDAVPVDILQSIEVSKAILPDMDADAIGGAVNLVTIKAPDARFVALEAAGGFGTIRDDASGNGSLTLGNRFADGRLGLLLTGSFSQRNFGSDDLEPVYDLGDPGLGDDALAELETRHYTLWRRRMGGTASLDYRLSDNSSWTLTGIYTELTDVEQRRNYLNVVEDDELAFLHKNRREELEMYSVGFTGRHLLPAGLDVDYRAAFSRSAEHTPYDTEIEFVQEGVSFDPDLSDPDRIRANPAPGSENGDFAFNAVEPASSDTHTRDMVGGVNLAIPYALGGTATGRLTFGVQYRDKEKVQDVREEAFELADGFGDILLGQDVGSAFAVSDFNPGPYPFAPNSTSPDEVIDFSNSFGSNLDGEIDLEAETNDYDLTERVVAGYVMTEVNLTPDLMVLPGIRYEQTRVESAGFDFDPDTETLSPTTGEKDYGTFFPMVHLRYAVGSQTNIRAAYTTTISRPNFFLLVPYRLRDDEDRELGNPDLDPTIARSVDFLVEHYDRRIGIMSAGVFYKRLSDPIFLFTTDNELGGQDVQPGNGDAGTIRGVEVALQQQLRFLPAPFDGLGVYANYTYTDSEATLPGGREARLQGQADHVFNTAVSYERGVFSGQVSLNYHDNYVGEYGGDEGTVEEELEDVYIDRHMQLDASASLRTTNRSALFVELVNLTNEPFKAYQGVRERPIQMEYYERWGRLGFRYSW
jgi:TonB-dependent receptor